MSSCVLKRLHPATMLPLISCHVTLNVTSKQKQIRFSVHCKRVMVIHTFFHKFTK